MQPRLTIQASPAASSTTTSSAVRPDGNESVTVRSHVGPLLGRALLVERLGLGAVDEALEHDGPIADAAERARRDGEVVADEVELRELRLAREVELRRVRDAHDAAVDCQVLGRLVFSARVPPPRTVLPDGFDTLATTPGYPRPRRGRITLCESNLA